MILDPRSQTDRKLVVSQLISDEPNKNVRAHSHHNGLYMAFSTQSFAGMDTLVERKQVNTLT